MEATIAFFSEYKSVFVIVHVFGVILGMGSALVSDVLFNTFIKDFKIDLVENRVLGILSKIIWVGLLFMVISGVAMFLSDPEKYAESVKFLIKMTVVGFIIVNGVLFQKVVHPALRKIDFRDQNRHHKYVKIRRLSFAFGSISVISWLSAFLLASQDAIPFSYGQALAIYLGICVLGIIASQILEGIVTRKH